VDDGEARRRVGSARVGRLGTLSGLGRPHVVPCCFVLEESRIYSAVDGKPKSTMALARLDNLRANPAATLLVDHYEEDWGALWWVRLDGRGSIAHEGPERDHALGLLAAKYDQYRQSPPPGPVIAVAVQRWSWWEATPT
jgi:PPOX class probable F420-dependent enzyme